MSGGRVEISLQPDVLRWARERDGLGVERLAAKVGVRPERVVEWERSGRISISQAARLARRTHTPLGHLYLPEAPDDDLPIPDFRAPQLPPRCPSPGCREDAEYMANHEIRSYST